ncbi:uncharacterized protein LOC141690700 [Apium graveolens]|uniref:uncharacterized protein LOC141690700 n=1 Tax=Apium graveolens TaxID=4045 RepID=UPI003D79EB48
MALVEDCAPGYLVNFYIDNIVDKQIKSAPQMQPQVITQPRENFIQASSEKPLKRNFVTTHQIQQQQKKMDKKFPEDGGWQDILTKESDKMYVMDKKLRNLRLGFSVRIHFLTDLAFLLSPDRQKFGQVLFDQVFTLLPGRQGQEKRMKKARLAGLDTRGKATEPIFLKKHKEPIGEASTEGAGGHGTPITAAAPTAAATGAFQPLWGFRRGDTVVGSTKHAWDWSYHSVTPKDFTDVVATPDLERIKLMGAQSLASSNAYFQGAVRQAESWKRASDKADNALRRQQKKYATLEKKLKRKEEELGESNAELVVLRAEKDKAIDNYLDSEEFAQSMRIRDDSVFPEFFRTGWDTALGTVNEACPDINPADYICPDDEALLQRFRTRVVVSDHVPQDPLLPPPESSSRPAEDDSSSSSSETTETSSESGEDDDMDAEGTSAP